MKPDSPEFQRTLAAELRALPDRPAPARLAEQVLYRITLEATARNQLAQLPPVPAPASLIPRVLATISERARQLWWQQSFALWPARARVLIALATISLAGALFYAGWWVQTTFVDATVARLASQWQTSWQAFWEVGTALLQAVALLGGKSQTLLLVAAGLIAASYFVCLAVGTVCFKLALSQRKIGS